MQRGLRIFTGLRGRDGKELLTTFMASHIPVGQVLPMGGHTYHERILRRAGHDNIVAISLYPRRYKFGP